MLPRIHAAALATVVLLGASGPAGAQRPALTPGARVRVPTEIGVPKPARSTGRVLRLVSDTLYVHLERGDTLALPAGTRLQVSQGRTGSHLTTGAFVGWGVGAAAVLVALATSDAESSSRSEGVGPVMPLTSVIGAGIGRLIPRERWIDVRVPGAPTPASTLPPR